MLLLLELTLLLLELRPGLQLEQERLAQGKGEVLLEVLPRGEEGLL